jgi:hypothetical protein
MLPAMVRGKVSREEAELAVHLRTNDMLYEALKKLIESRIRGRATVIEPENPIECRALLARDGECRWFLNAIERARNSRSQESTSEPPAA